MEKITCIPQKPQFSRISFVSYVYFALFFISGISGLIYESIWSQYLKQFLGHAAYSQTLVLVIYMGGMALGAWFAAAWASKPRSLLSAYAVVEIILGASALVFHDVFIGYLDFSFSTVIPYLNNPLPISLYKWVTASLIILPQSMLLGATFPLMAGGILRRFPGLSGYKTSVIYFVNTLGASLGVLISGFYLVKEWGLKGAIISGGLIDLFVGFAILVLSMNDRRQVSVSGNNNGADVNSNLDNSDSIRHINNLDNSDSIRHINNLDNSDSISDINYLDNSDSISDTNYLDNSESIDDVNNLDNSDVFNIQGKHDYYYPLLFVACLTATASFIYEIAWIRMLSLVLGSSTHSFELMLSAFIFGLALGSFFVRKRLDTAKNLPRLLGIAQVVMGAAAIATLFTYGGMFKFMVFTIDALDKTAEGYMMFNVISHLICMLVMLPSTFCAGMVVPLIIHMLYKKGYGEAAIGKVYAVNTAGGIIGVVAAGWFLMELVGLKYLIIIGGALDMGLGLYVLYRFRQTRESVTRLVAQPVCIAVLVAAFAFGKFDPVLASSGVFRYGTISKAKKVVEHRDGKTASITLFKSGGSLVLSTNGKPDASVGVKDGEFSTDEYTMSLLGVLPLSVREETRTAAVIGMGAGMTAHYMLYDPALEQLDIVEIEPAMAKLAKKIGPKVENTFNDPRSHIYIEDAKTFFSARNRAYDVIVSEPSNPWVSGVSSLFSKEFFDRIRRHLNDGGILVQWFHKYEADVTILVSILKALGESFPVYDMYAAGSDIIIIAAKDADTDISLKRDVFVNAALAESMGKMGFAGIDDFKHLRYAGKEFLQPLIETYDTPANSDYHSFVDLYAVKYRFMSKRVDELDAIRNFIIPVRKIIFADTGYAGLAPRAIIPDLYNLQDVQNAKTLSQELSLSARDGVSGGDGSANASIFILDYAAARPHKTSFAQIQSAIIQILQKTLPYLSADEMKEVWEIIEKKTAGREYSENEREWMDYFKAVCNYDIIETRRLSLSLMPADSISDHYSNQMLIGSLLASAAVLGDTSKTGRVWEKYDEKKNPPAAIRAARTLMLNSKLNSKYKSNSNMEGTPPLRGEPYPTF